MGPSGPRALLVVMDRLARYLLEVSIFMTCRLGKLAYGLAPTATPDRL